MFTQSQKLATLIREIADAGWDESEFADLTSTSGYDNDGSTGPELVENGVRLGLATAAYQQQTGKPVTIFVCAGAFGASEDDNQTAYYAYGTDEDDAVRRVRADYEQTRRDNPDA